MEKKALYSLVRGGESERGLERCDITVVGTRESGVRVGGREGVELSESESDIIVAIIDYNLIRNGK